MVEQSVEMNRDTPISIALTIPDLEYEEIMARND